MKDDEIMEFVEEESKRLGIDEPHIVMRKMKSTFGLASREWQITLNRSWCHKSGDIIVKQMISHELMHLRDFWIRGFSKHDKFFRDMCNSYGIYLDCRMSTKNKRNKIVKKIKEKDRKV
jgi:predicted SprT family Zn-dependent metalloprotease